MSFVPRNYFVNSDANSIKMLCGPPFESRSRAKTEDGLQPIPREAGKLEVEGDLDTVSAVSFLRCGQVGRMITASSSTYMTPFSRFYRVRPCFLDNFLNI
jgi:hypothetical protein